MNIYHLPEKLKGIIFDIDSTLYRNREYAESQEELLVRTLAEYKGLDYKKARSQVTGIRSRYKENHGGRSLSLGNTFLEFGISIKQNCTWRDQLFEPEAFLSTDEKLVETIGILEERFSIITVTNNTRTIGRRTLESLGLGEKDIRVIGLDDCYVSKPAAEPFLKGLETMGLEPEEVVSIGDRFAVDLEVPLSMGMGGVLVENMQDIYNLSKYLIS